MTESKEIKAKRGDTLPTVSLPIIVEGRYDKSAILGMLRATVITTEGFGIFNSKEKQALIRRVAEKGVILLTDSDGGGRQIRSFLTSILPADKVYQLYIPKIKGKEKRKQKGSKEGTLGVEGVGGDVLRSVLKGFISEDGDTPTLASGAGLTPAELYRDGLSGGDGSQARRDALCALLSLPDGMSAKALLTALNIAVSREEYTEALAKLSRP